jgi:hypothetical protein
VINREETNGDQINGEETSGDQNGRGRFRRWLIQRSPTQRRPTRRHRRNRLIRRIMVVLVLAFFAAGLSAFALLYLSPSLVHSSQRKIEDIDRQKAEAYRAQLLRSTQESLRPNARRKRPVYPYSVVPGGVEDARELKWAAANDPIVAAHYAGFDYDHARVIRVTVDQTVFVSYRIGNHIYWSRHRLKLRKGEKLITDGKITARARCANRVEEVPQQLNSPSEPPPAKFDEPMLESAGSSTTIPPVEFQSALLNRPLMSGVEPTPPLSLYNPFSFVNVVPFSPPPLPTSVCSPKKPAKGEIEELSGDVHKKKKGGPCGMGGGGAKTPEPGTWLLLITGVAAIWWCVRRTALPARS